ncbi:MAG: MFS transporter [Lentisphaeraceae bacterium]|nr:MFS transporter [Lentisphaeraceae bacterium]
MFKSHIPFSPKKLPFYYGWLIVPAAIAGVLMSLPGQTAGFSAFTDPLLNSLGISRSTLAFSYFLGTISSGFILPKAGRFLDRFGTRLTIFIVAFSLGIILTTFSYCEFILKSLKNTFSFISPDVLTIIVLSLLILGLRFFGQGMLPMISNTMVGRWFDKKRGKVVAVMGMINSLVFNAAPYLLSLLVAAYSWQESWRIMAIVAGVFFSILSWVFFRDNPEDCGLKVDGELVVDTEDDTPPEMTGCTVDEAYKTLTFKVITFTLSLYGMTLTGMTFHLEAIGTEAGLSKEAAMAIFVPVTFITVPVGFLASWLSDKVPLKRLVMSMALTQALAYFSFAFISTRLGYFSSVLFLGMSGGMFGPLLTIAFPWFFGRKFLGSINGKVTSFLVIFSAIGPMVFSLFKDSFSSFAPALYLCTLFPLIAFFLCFKISNEKMY